MSRLSLTATFDTGDADSGMPSVHVAQDGGHALFTARAAPAALATPATAGLVATTPMAAEPAAVAPVALPGGVLVYPCAAWGARPPLHEFAATAPSAMVLHHMDYPNRDPIADRAQAIEAAFDLARRCQADHMDHNGWADTGQHFTVSIDGIICEGRHGSLDAVLAGHCIRGAHAADADVGVDFNDSWGTEHEGTYDTAHMPAAQWSASVALHAAIALLCKLDSSSILGHRDTGCVTDCCGNWFEAQIPRFRDDVHNAAQALHGAFRANAVGIPARLVSSLRFDYAPDDPELTEQLALIRSDYLTFIQEGAANAGVPTSIVAGIGSRESHWGRLLTPPGPGGTGDFTPRNGRVPSDGKGFGRGLMQIDYDAHDFARTGNWPDPRANVLYGCEVLRESLTYIGARTRLTGDALLRAAIAGYNAGEGQVASDVNAGRDPDTLTAHHNYSADVLALAAWFRDKGIG